MVRLLNENNIDTISDIIYRIFRFQEFFTHIKEVNKQITSYKAVKALEIKEGEFEKTSTMKIKRYKELNK